MSTTEERIARIHERARELKEERRRRIMRIEGAVSVVLGVLLVVMIGFLSVGTGGASTGTVPDAGYAGASMFGSEAGGYILTALVAFMLGALITILVRTHVEKNKQ